MFGARAGTDPSLLRILFGSRIDSVPNGGNFDGRVGSMSAIEVIETLEEHHVTTRHPLEMVIRSNEENLVGSPAAAGLGLETLRLASRAGYDAMDGAVGADRDDFHSQQAYLGAGLRAGSQRASANGSSPGRPLRAQTAPF